MSIMLIKEKSFQNLFVHLCEEDFNAMGEGATFQDIQDLIEKNYDMVNHMYQSNQKNYRDYYMAEIEIRALDRKMTDVVPIIREQAIATLQCTIYNSYETQDLSRMEAFKEELLKRYDMTYTDVEGALDLNKVTWG